MEHIQLNCELLSLTITETSNFLSALFFLFFMQYFFKKPQCHLRHMKGKSWFCFLVRVCSSVDRVRTPVRPRWDLDPPQPVSILQVIRNQFQKSGPSPLSPRSVCPAGSGGGRGVSPPMGGNTTWSWGRVRGWEQCAAAAGRFWTTFQTACGW